MINNNSVAHSATPGAVSPNRANIAGGPDGNGGRLAVAVFISNHYNYMLAPQKRRRADNSIL